jgi:hypothetical protein
MLSNFQNSVIPTWRILKVVRWREDEDAIAHDTLRIRDNVTGIDEARFGQFRFG